MVVPKAKPILDCNSYLLTTKYKIDIEFYKKMSIFYKKLIFLAILECFFITHLNKID